MTQITLLDISTLDPEVVPFVSIKAKTIEYAMRHPDADVKEIQNVTGAAPGNSYHYRKLAKKLRDAGISADQWVAATIQRIRNEVGSPLGAKRYAAIRKAQSRSAETRKLRKQRGEKRKFNDDKYIARVVGIVSPNATPVSYTPPNTPAPAPAFEPARAGSYPWENYEAMMGTEAYAGFLRGVIMTAITSRDTSMLAEAEAAIKKLRFIS